MEGTVLVYVALNVHSDRRVGHAERTQDEKSSDVYIPLRTTCVFDHHLLVNARCKCTRSNCTVDVRAAYKPAGLDPS